MCYCLLACVVKSDPCWSLLSREISPITQRQFVKHTWRSLRSSQKWKSEREATCQSKYAEKKRERLPYLWPFVTRPKAFSFLRQYLGQILLHLWLHCCVLQIGFIVSCWAFSQTLHYMFCDLDVCFFTVHYQMFIWWRMNLKKSILSLQVLESQFALNVRNAFKCQSVCILYSWTQNWFLFFVQDLWFCCMPRKQ